MSFPINPTTVAAAARIATEVVSRIGDAVSFDEVLRSTPSTPESAQVGAGEAEDSRGGWLQRTVARIRELFQGAGVASDQPVTLAASAEGQLRLTDDHPRAAELESLLASDGELQRLVVGLVRETGQSTLTVASAPEAGMLGPAAEADLTRIHPRGNMK